MTNRPVDGWWKRAFFGLHYDLHAGAQDTQLGAELTPAHLREQLEKVRPDFVQCDCKGHAGYTSYPTRIGSPSPGIVKDALRIHRDVTRDLGIPLSVHYSGVWDARAIELHPEWSARDSKGRIVKPLKNVKHGITCRLGPYLDELMIPQLLEIIDDYDVDGFWIDGDNWAVKDCYCPRCRAEFTKRTGLTEAPTRRSHPHWPAWRAFQRDVFVEYVRRYTDAIHQRKPECAVCSNWMYSMRQPGPVAAPVDYLSGDFMSSFGCERAEMEGRYLDGHGMPWNLMAWTFCAPAGSPHQMKTVTHLCQESAEVMSCGGAVFLYNQPQRSGWLTGWHQDIFAQVAAFCREREPFCKATRSIPECAVLLSDPHFWKRNTEPFCMGDAFHGGEGTLHVLMENQYHVDVLNETRLLARLETYALVAVGEQDPISPAVVQALEEYARAGGVVLMTGSHLASSYAGLVGAKAVGSGQKTAWHVPVRGEAATLAGPWRKVKMTDAAMYAPVMTQQQPGKDETHYPAVTIRRVGQGAVAAIHGPVMLAYYQTHHPRLRWLIQDLLDCLKVKRRVLVQGSPSLEVTLRQGDGFIAVHLVNRAVNPTLTPRLHIVETVPAADAVGVKVRLDQRPNHVRLEPGGRALDWSFADGWLEVAVNRVHIHEIVVITT